jgi:hypothetical protein
MPVKQLNPKHWIDLISPGKVLQPCIVQTLNFLYKSKNLVKFELLNTITMSRTEPIVLNKKGKAVAVQIPMNQYKKLLELAEEMEDIKAYDRALKRKHSFLPFHKAVKELKIQRKKS